LKRSIIGIVLASFVLFSFQSSSAYTVTYEKWGSIIKDIPTVCIFEPDYKSSQILSETFANRVMDETRISVNEWMVQLQISERGRDKSMWKINQIPILFDEQEGFDYDKCTIFIKFKEKPESQDEWYKLLGKTSYELGDTGRSDITIYYGAIELCKTEDKKWVYFDPCYENYPRLMQQLKSVIKHEFGHALGLGHYVADDLDVNVGWARGSVPSPSIMAVFTHQNIYQNYITPDDVAAVRSMYGENGFFPTPEDEIFFESFQPSSFVYTVPKGGFIVASVDGLLSKDKYISGVPVEITIRDPNDSILTRNVWANSDGVFNFQIIINEDKGLGTYVTHATYRDKKSPQTAFVITTIGNNEQSKIPQWIKNSVRWWAEDKIKDLDFILGIQYLIKEGILNPPSHEDKIAMSYDPNKGIGVQIPLYVKQTSLWWTQDKIPDDEFVAGIQYLIKKGILVI
jgi:hypothetical protein